MPKITLPPKVKCWRCEGKRVVSNGHEWIRCDCDDGERYVFDDLAAAVRKAGLFYELKDPYPNKDAKQCRVEIITQPKFRGWSGIICNGPNPTTALLAAIEKFNAE